MRGSRLFNISASFSESQFASLARNFGHGNYHMTGAGQSYSTGSGVKHNYLSFDPSKVDKLGLGLAALSAGTDAGPMIVAASPGTGPAAPFVFAAGLGYTGVGLATDLVVDVVIPIKEAINGNTAPVWESIAVECHVKTFRKRWSVYRTSL